MADTRPTFRFAPSPNGRLHLGHALSALVGYDWARRVGGRFLLRIEDIDLARSRPEHIQGIFDDLAWLGLRWEEPVLFQSSRFAAYRAAADRLAAAGVLYPCFATRAEIEAAWSNRTDGVPRDPDGQPLYPGLYRHASAARIAERNGEPFALRIDVAKALALAADKTGGRDIVFSDVQPDGTATDITCDPAAWGDAVLVRKDTPTSYHLAVVVDDADQGVTHVTRGRDLFRATDLQRLLQVLLDLPAPLYHHHALVTDETGRKLSKSARDTSLAELRQSGVSAREVWRRLNFSP